MGQLSQADFNYGRCGLLSAHKLFKKFFRENIKSIIHRHSRSLPSVDFILNTSAKNDIFQPEDKSLVMPNVGAMLRENILNCNISARESEILRKCLEGKSAKEIADDLCISHRTVQNNVEKIKQKFNCQSITQLLSLFIGDNVLLNL